MRGNGIDLFLSLALPTNVRRLPASMSGVRREVRKEGGEAEVAGSKVRMMIIIIVSGDE